ncbi:MAG: hypothetical protein GY856_21790 [bacterium]|nr:hypothetical protein [bacterium]
MRATPEPRLIADREIAMVLRPSSTEITWQITLPDGWCPPKVGEQRVGNDLGVFYQAIAHRLNGQVVIDRKIELRQRWIEPEMLPALKELALAEHRARRRRIRLECEDSAGVVTGSPGSAPALIRREANTFSGGAHQ